MTPRALLFTAAAVAVLCACTSAPVTRYYVLSASAPAPARPAGAGVAVVIKDVRLPQYLDRSQIVTRGGDHRLQMDEHAQWAGNLREDMTRVLVENLRRLLGSERVIAAPHSLRLLPDYRVEVEVLSFERELDGRVGLSARWWLMHGSDATLLASAGTTLFGTALGQGAHDEELVASMSSVYGELARAIAQGIGAHRAKGPRGAGGS